MFWCTSSNRLAIWVFTVSFFFICLSLRGKEIQLSLWIIITSNSCINLVLLQTFKKEEAALTCHLHFATFLKYDSDKTALFLSCLQLFRSWSRFPSSILSVQYSKRIAVPTIPADLQFEISATVVSPSSQVLLWPKAKSDQKCVQNKTELLLNSLNLN